MYVDILLLAELTTGPKHGYEIKKNVQNRLGENFELNHNMLYPALRRFENMGAITKKIHKQVGKTKPKYVRYNRNRRRNFFLKCYESFPKNLRQTIQNFLFVLRYLKKLDYEDRKEILTVRQNVLYNQLTAIQSLDVTSSFITEVIEFSKSRIEHELSWITSLMKKNMKKITRKVKNNE